MLEMYVGWKWEEEMEWRKYVGNVEWFFGSVSENYMRMQLYNEMV